MNLSLSEDQVLIKESAEKFLNLNYSFEKRRSFLENKKEAYKNNWKNFAERGWLGLAFSEDVGAKSTIINEHSMKDQNADTFDSANLRWHCSNF